MRILLILTSLLLMKTANLSAMEPTRARKDYALFFAVSNYTHEGLTDLSQPLKDAQDLAGELERRYGFQTEVVKDPSLAQMRDKLMEYQQKFIDDIFPADGQLLIFFSGHGVREYGAGYFLPSDADPAHVITTGFPYETWRGFINQINCRHILVAVDACFSVTFDPDWESKGSDGSRFGRVGELSETERILANHQEYNARLFFTSDSREEPTPGDSNFARKLLDGLSSHQNSDPFMSAEELFAGYVKKAQPSPKAGYFGKDDPRSNFLFFFQTETTKIEEERNEVAAFQDAKNQHTSGAYNRYLQTYPNGEFVAIARQQLGFLEAEEREQIAWQQTKTKHTYVGYGDFINAYPNSAYLVLAEQAKSTLPTTYTKNGKYDRRPLSAIEYNSYRTQTGTVKDASTGFPLIGANIIATIDGMQLGAVTDQEGNFTLRIHNKVKVFKFSFPGYKTVELPINYGTTTPFAVRLEKDN